MTVHILSAGDGYAYYTSEVATGDAKRESGRELGDYYTADGNPPGVWVGSGLDALSGFGLSGEGVSGRVSEEQMKALYGEGLHPDAERIITEAQKYGASVSEAHARAKLGRSYYAYETGGTDLGDRITEGYAAFERMNHRPADVNDRRKIRTREGAQAFRDAKGRPPTDKEELGRYITAATRPTAQAVAGFDLVFSPAKSVSVLWGLGDNDTRKSIEAAHEAAIADTIGYLEREAIATRAGTNGVAQIEVQGGLIATRFRHYDSRTGDPQLHDHVVVANKVKGIDGKWRTIDSKLLHRQGVAASEFYNARVMERVQDALDVATELREVTPGKRPVVEIAGVDERLGKAFATRSEDIREAVHRLEAEYRDTHGRAPDAKARIALAQQATLETRPAKPHARSLEQLREAWRGRAAEVLGEDLVDGILDRARASAAMQATSATSERVSVAAAAAAVVETVSEHHAVWGPHMIEAEARRYLQARRAEGIAVDGDVEAIARHALNVDSISVTPPSPHGTFQPLTRGDGSSIYEHKGRALLTSSTVLAAEDVLMSAAQLSTERPVERDTFDLVAERENTRLMADGRPLDPGQLNLAREFATSDRVVLIGTGAAGTGKTTALEVAARAIEEQGGRMIGLAPSATAAAVMSEAIGIDAHTIHSFLFFGGPFEEYLADDSPTDFDVQPGDVIVVDEAGMAGSVNLAKIARIAERNGAHVRLIGDDRQLSAVEAGGALRLLEREVGAVHLEQLHRFANRDEADATLLLRDPALAGDPFRWYVDNGRVIGGDFDRMTDEVFDGWRRDTAAGLDSVMLAQTNAAVAELNSRAQALRMSEGTVAGEEVAALRDGMGAHHGDVIVTRRNNSELRTRRGKDRVKNGDLWTVARIHDDGSLSVVHTGTGGRVTLPAEYVEHHVELGYALTVHRAQGMTADTAHMLADPSTSRELAYVALTRGREANHLYVQTEEAQSMHEVLDTIAGNADGLLSAHDTIRAEQARVEDLVTLVDQYRDVAERADTERLARLAHQVLDDRVADQLVDAESWGAVTAALVRAEGQNLNPAEILGEAWDEREVATAADVGAVLSSRIQRRLEVDREAEPTPAVESESAEHAVPQWIADRRVIDAPNVDPAWKEHLEERYEYLHARIEERGATIAAERPEWTVQLGAVPAEPERRDEWTRLAAEVDIFRDRYGVDRATSEAIPEQHREQETGANLHVRVTALHKSSALREHAERREDPQELAAADERAPEAVSTPAEVAAAQTPAERLRDAARAKNEAAREAQRRAGLKVKARDAAGRETGAVEGKDQSRSRDDGLER